MEKLQQDPVFDLSIQKKWERHELAAKILCAMVAVPENKTLDFDTMADFATRYADALIKKLNEPEV